MDSNGCAEYLYHYTNINALENILKNKSIRFKSLEGMDDMEEVETEGIKKLGKYCFVSSWSKEIKESIPMWDKYGDNHSGVRIKLHSVPFETYSWDTHGIKGAKGYMRDVFFSKQMYTNYDFLPVPAPINFFIVEVQYDNEPAKIYPNVFKILEGIPFVDLDIVGKYKRIDWDYQKEVRYRIFLLPQNYYEILESADPITALIYGKNLSINFFDLFIKDEYMKSIEIIKGAKMSTENSQKVDEIVEKYCPTAKIFDSYFKGKIR